MKNNQLKVSILKQVRESRRSFIAVRRQPFFIDVITITIIGMLLLVQPVNAQNHKRPSDIYSRDNLVAWCIVPFDSKNRGPEQRAQMLDSLGITRLAYDWRPEHIPTFDQELEALKSHHIQLQAFWLPTGPDPAGD